MTSPLRRAALAGALLSLLAAAPASAVTVADPAGDAVGGDPGHDIVSFDWTYDAALGRVNGTITLAGTTTAAPGVLIYVGKRAADGRCTYTDGLGIITAAGGPDSADPTWIRNAGGAQVADGRGTLSKVDRTTSLTIEDARLANLGYDCAKVETHDPAAIATVYDNTDANAVAPPPPPVVTPPPAPPAAAALAVRLRGVPAKLKRGRTARIRLVVTNTGTAPTPALRARVRAVRGLVRKPRAVTVPALAPQASTTVRFRVELGRKAKRSTKLVVRVAGAGLSATARKTLRRR